MAATALRMAGARVSTASSGREALEQLSSGEWDLVVTDISMPDGTGYDLIDDARRAGHGVPMIAVTAFDTPEHRARIQNSGFVGQLTKPLLPERLIAAVWEVANAAEAMTAPPSSEARNGSAVDEVTRWSAAPGPSLSAAPRDSTE